MPDARSPAPASAPRPLDLALLASVFVIAACGLLYELAAGALAAALACSAAWIGVACQQFGFDWPEFR